MCLFCGEVVEQQLVLLFRFVNLITFYKVEILQSLGILMLLADHAVLLAV